MSAAAIAIIVVVAVVVLVVAAMAVTRRRLQHRFGPEYDRVVESHGQFRATAELARRERRVQRLRIRPLTPAARAEYVAEWRTTQEGFVDQPQHAVIEAQDLLASVMKERGYPAEDADQIVADLSVTHADTLDHYRAARQISADADRGDASTEDLRQALIHVRAVFAEVLGKPEEAEPQGQPVPAPPVPATPPMPATAVPATPLPEGAGPGPGAEEDQEPKEQLWRPIRVPQARTPDEEAP